MMRGTRKKDKLGADDRDGELGRVAHCRHAEEEHEPPEEETARVGEVRAKVDLERQVDHGEEERDDEVEHQGREDAVGDVGPVGEGADDLRAALLVMVMMNEKMSM
jgi:hypothetical protein